MGPAFWVPASLAAAVLIAGGIFMRRKKKSGGLDAGFIYDGKTNKVAYKVHPDGTLDAYNYDSDGKRRKQRLINKSTFVGRGNT